jgi:hypothetical protein
VFTTGINTGAWTNCTGSNNAIIDGSDVIGPNGGTVAGIPTTRPFTGSWIQIARTNTWFTDVGSIQTNGYYRQ